MPRPSRTGSTAKPAGLHPRNRHQGRYDLAALAVADPGLRRYLIGPAGPEQTVDFHDPQAVMALNRALLRLHYGIRDWSVPPGYLCPPVPGRADYLHHAADLLASDLLPGQSVASLQGNRLRALDIGCGANLIYPLLGQAEYGWRFVGADIDAPALANAERLLAANADAAARITLRRQAQPQHIFTGVIQPDDVFALTLCNPPFHRSLAEAEAGTVRKQRGIARSADKNDSPLRAHSAKNSARGASNFAGRAAELACAGGERGFITRMLEESERFGAQVLWFTTLVSRSDNLPALRRVLQQLPVADSRVLLMAQGQKQSRVLAWSFQSTTERRQQLQQWLGRI